MSHRPCPAQPTPARASAARKRARRNCSKPRSTLFVEKGFAATRTEEVAARAGVSKGTLYLYYPSKEELFKAVVRHNLSSLIAEGEALAEQFEGSSSELLRRLMHAWWQRVGDTPAAGIFKIVHRRGAQLPRAGAVLLPTRSSCRPSACSAARVQRGIDRGEFRPDADARGGADADRADDLHGRAPALPRRLPGARRHGRGSRADAADAPRPGAARPGSARRPAAPGPPPARRGKKMPP